MPANSACRRGSRSASPRLAERVAAKVPCADLPDALAELIRRHFPERLSLSADDQWEGWVDGVLIDRQEGWNQADEYSFVLASGAHVIAVRAEDLHQIINGFIAAVDIDGQSRSLSGDGLWRVSAVEPAADWTDLSFFDGDWAIPTICSDDAPWSGMPTLVDPDAEWIWHDADCRQELGTGWFRLSLELP